ncbi:MAG: Na/Pi symporter, partial [Gammaproteobacteria bacterium]|nr:Na/Pi symporter [Gammaproteobacteria bacterium]
MLQKVFLTIIIFILAYGLWLSPAFGELAIGLAIFLFGMLSFEQGFKLFSGGLLEEILAKATDRIPKSLSFGVIITLILQSSSLVTAITISFVSAGLVNLAAAIGIIIGANLGTTSGAWLMATLGLKINIALLGTPMLVFGVLFILQRINTLKAAGYVLAGLGFLFLGMQYMKTGFNAYKETIDFARYAMVGFEGLFVFAFIGTIATVILQTSHATLVLTLAALASQQLSYENALAIAIGANIGTTITAIMASIGANVDGKRLALIHVVFNLVTGLVAIVLLSPLIHVVDWISNSIGLPQEDYTLKFALFHTLFNLLGLLLFAPFINQLVSVLTKYVKTPATSLDQPKFINASVLELPSAAVEATRKEVQHLYNNAFRLFAHGLSLHRGVINSEQDLSSAIGHTTRVMQLDIDDYYDRYIKELYSDIIEFISRAQTKQFPEHLSNEIYALRQASRDIVEAVKAMKHLHKNLSHYILSPNEQVRNQYNQIRLEIATILRDISAVATTPADTPAV